MFSFYCTRLIVLCRQFLPCFCRMHCISRLLNVNQNVFVTALTCEKNQEFSYNVRACNHTCRSLSAPDPRCGQEDAPVEGCGCPEGTHLNQGQICTPKTECVCHHHGGITPPGPVVIDGRQW